MKKILGLVAAVMLTSSAFASDAADKPLVSIDSILIMQKSKEGQKLAGEIQKDISKFQELLKSSQQELVKLQEDLNKQANVLSAEAKQEKTETLAKKRKDLERTFADKEEGLRASIQKRQLALRDSQLKVINKVFAKEQWGLIIDKNTPGVLCVNAAIDKTPEVLKAVDASFVESKAGAKTTVKAASNNVLPKPEVKAA